MKKRAVQPELLDGMAGDDPYAVRSRSDLVMINFLMGNLRWIRRAVACALADGDLPVWEIGAGDGGLVMQLAEDGAAVTGVDLQPRPEEIGESASWRESDVFDVLKEGISGVVVANLFLHHFQDRELAEMGRMLDEVEVICVSEPWRSRLGLLEGYFLYPFVNSVTRHDMMISIRAGFRRGELPGLLGLGDEWELREECTKMGAYRMLAWRK